MKLQKSLFLLMLSTMLLLTAGCDQQGGNEPPKASVSETAPAGGSSSKPADTDTTAKAKAPQTVEVDLYYPDAEGMKLVAVHKKLEVGQSDPYTVAVQELMKKPADKKLTGIFPKAAKLRSVTLKGDTAVVDFDSSIKKGFSGGSTGEEFLVGSVVNTLTNFPEIKKVQILLDGREVESLAGHMDLTRPLERMTELLGK